MPAPEMDASSSRRPSSLPMPSGAAQPPSHRPSTTPRSTSTIQADGKDKGAEAPSLSSSILRPLVAVAVAVWALQSVEISAEVAETTLIGGWVDGWMDEWIDTKIDRSWSCLVGSHRSVGGLEIGTGGSIDTQTLRQAASLSTSGIAASRRWRCSTAAGRCLSVDDRRIHNDLAHSGSNRPSSIDLYIYTHSQTLAFSPHPTQHIHRPAP